MSWFSDVKWWEWIIPPIALNHALINGIKAQIKKPGIPGIIPQRVQTSSEGLPIPFGYGMCRISGNVIWRKDQVLQADGSYAVPMIIALCEGPLHANPTGKMWVESKRYATIDLGWVVQSGARTQAPWAWLTANYPAEALGYGGTALLCNPAVGSDSAGNVEPITIETRFSSAAYSRSYAATDALPSDILTDVITSTLYAAGWPGARLASMATGPDGLAASSADRYCHALAFYLSLLVSEQRTVLDVVEEVLGACNLTAFRSGAQIKVVPLGDTEVTRDAFTYTPCTVVRHHFTDADFLCGEEEDPLSVEIRKREDVFNDWPIEYTDRGTDYELRTLSYPDAADVDEIGEQRTAQKLSFPSITDAQHATALSKILAQHSIHTRRTFTWRASRRHCRLQQVDLVSLTCSRLGLAQFVVRISTIEEEEYQGAKALRFHAEEVVQGVGHAIGYVPQASGGTATNTATAPGNASTPVLAQAPAAYAGGKQRVFVVTSGGADWGGAEVWTSWDDSSWTYQGAIARGVHGVLSAILASGSDPDVTNTLAVDLAVSGGQLPSSSTTERDALSTLCYVDGEWVSYATSSNPTGTSTNLTSLRRGVWGSAVASHAAGSIFGKVGPDTFRLDIDAARVGQTLRVKLLSFNRWGNAKQALADVSAASVVIAAQPRNVRVDNVAPGAVGTDHITPGGVDWSRISAGQGNTANLWPNPNSEEAPPSGADLTSPEWAKRYNAGGGAYSGTYVRRLTDGEAVALWVPCSVGDSYYVQAQAQRTVGSGYVRTVVEFYAADKATSTGGGSTSSSATGSWGLISCSAKAPPGTAWVRAYLEVQASTTGYFDQIYAGRMISTALLEAEAVKSPDYAEDGSGNPTAGYLLRMATAGAEVAKFAPGGIKIGKTLLDEAWFARSFVSAVYVNRFGSPSFDWQVSSPGSVWEFSSYNTTDNILTLRSSLLYGKELYDVLLVGYAPQSSGVGGTATPGAYHVAQLQSSWQDGTYVYLELTLHNTSGTRQNWLTTYGNPFRLSVVAAKTNGLFFL